MVDIVLVARQVPRAELNQVFGKTPRLQKAMESLFYDIGAAFSVNSNGVSQSIPTSAATKLTLSSSAFNVGGTFADSAWTPPAGRIISITAVATLSLSGAGSAWLSVFKNGAEFRRGPTTIASGASSVTLSVSCIDEPSGTDAYDIRVTQTTGSAQGTDGNPVLTSFQGTQV